MFDLFCFPFWFIVSNCTRHLSLNLCQLNVKEESSDLKSAIALFFPRCKVFQFLNEREKHKQSSKIRPPRLTMLAQMGKTIVVSLIVWMVFFLSFFFFVEGLPLSCFQSEYIMYASEDIIIGFLLLLSQNGQCMEFNYNNITIGNHLIIFKTSFLEKKSKNFK